MKQVSAAAMHGSPRLIPCAACGAMENFCSRLEIRDPLDENNSLKIVTCQNCGLCFINPQYPFDAYIDYYSTQYFDLLGENYDQARDALTAAYKERIGDEFMAFITEMKSDEFYLDIAAGTGTWLDIFQSFRADFPRNNITIIEPSMIACERLSARFPGLNVIPSALETSQLPENSYDYVLCSALIEHFTDPLEGLLHMNRLTRLGGRLMLMTPSLENDSFYFGVARFFKFVHTFYFTEKSLSALVEKAGFVKVSTRVVPGEKGSLLWFPFLLGVYEKKENKELSDLNALRSKSNSDLTCLEEASEIFRHARTKIWLYGLYRRTEVFRRKIKTILKVLVGKMTAFLV